MDGSRIPSFYKHSVPERLQLLQQRGLLSEPDHAVMRTGEHVLSVGDADRMVENVIGVFGLPLGVGLNFLINGKDYVVPMVVEEPSIVAGLSATARLVRSSGGFSAESCGGILMGQVQVVDAPCTAAAQEALVQRKQEIIDSCNALQPRLVQRGGGVRDFDVVVHPNACDRGDMIVVNLMVDTCDAMGANLVNTVCEGVAPLIEEITSGKVFLRILSNLTDRSLARAKAVFSVAALKTEDHRGERVRDGIILANAFAEADPYRAATHNKGIMNGIDAVAIATGNDWRAIEAAAHAYAARDGKYTSLTRWTQNDAGDLVGELCVPLKVGIVGGSLESNPAVPVALRMLGVASARELSEVMVAVGLAQNFAALKALATEGIQRGHMGLHARSVAQVAGAPKEIFEQVVDRLKASGQIKVWKAREIIDALQAPATVAAPSKVTLSKVEPVATGAAGHGKVVLLGEHAVVYGRHAVAAPIALAIAARVEPSSDDAVHLSIPDWQVGETLARRHHDDQATEPSLERRFLERILEKLGLRDRSGFSVTVKPHVPSAMGLGGSAALAVAVIRALGDYHGLGLSDGDVNRVAYEAEKLAHGTPSGIDNTLATYGELILYKRGEPPLLKPIAVKRPIPAVIGISGIASLTSETVARVRTGWENDKSLYEGIFDQIDTLSLRAVKAIEAGDAPGLGTLMNICQGLLNAMQVSCWQLEQMIEAARGAGALGAKLTGGGGGGSMVAVCPEGGSERVAEAIRCAGYRALITHIGQRKG